MHRVEARPGEEIDKTLKRLKNKMETDYVLDTVRAHRYFETPAERKKRKQKMVDKRNKQLRQNKKRQ
jgi:ribosomal protein S21